MHCLCIPFPLHSKKKILIPVWMAHLLACTQHPGQLSGHCGLEQDSRNTTLLTSLRPHLLVCSSHTKEENQPNPFPGLTHFMSYCIQSCHAVHSPDKLSTMFSHTLRFSAHTNEVDTNRSSSTLVPYRTTLFIGQPRI